MGKFEKGHKKVGGRKAGTPNKVNLKECTLRAFEKLGCEKYLIDVAKKNPNAFLNFAGKFIKQDIVLGSDSENPVEFVIRGYDNKYTDH